MAAIGLAGFGLRAIDAPVAPVMIGLILGPAAEQHLRRALAIGQGDWTILITRPLSAALLAVALGIFAWGVVRGRRDR
jgi:putative tricarboxylic transport membrane protein